MKKLHFDINCDMGESYGRYSVGNDQQMMSLIDSCNIACGFHGGDPKVIDETIQLALKKNIKVGAHPSYPDRQGFGRRNMYLPPNELYSLIRYQVAVLKGMTEANGGSLHHVKPHGALYNMATVDRDISTTIVEAVMSINDKLIIYAPYKSAFADAVIDKGMKVCYEAFADRRYNSDRTLVSRSIEGSVIHDPTAAKKQVATIAENSKVHSADGSEVELVGDTFCIHGDNPSAVKIAQMLNELRH